MFSSLEISKLNSINMMQTLYPIFSYFILYWSIFVLFQNHLERIIERPGRPSLPEHKPLSRRESCSVSAEDMKLRGITNSNRSVFTTIFELRQAGTEAVVSRPTVADLQVKHIFLLYIPYIHSNGFLTCIDTKFYLYIL